MSNEQMSVNRYDFYCSYDGGGPADAEISSDGSYVDHDDYQKLCLKYDFLTENLITVKRYDFFCSYDGGGPAEEEESLFGSYVRYEDYAILLGKIKLNISAV